MKSLRPSAFFGAVLAFSVPLHAQEVLKAAGTDWDYLLFKNALGNPIDPNNFDADFHTTWQDPVPLGYDGPAFLTGTGYFGYGTIDGSAITTNIWNPDGSLATNAPASGDRYTTYFRTTITPTQDVSVIRFTGIVDDGAIIYLDGAELTRVHMNATAPDAWLLSALNATGTETTVRNITEAVSLPAGVSVTVAVSVHNASAISSDMGFDFLIESGVAEAPANDNFSDANPLVGDLPLSATGASDDGIGGLGATKEVGEPDHAGELGGGSVWWSWTPASDGRVSVSTEGSDFNTLLAIYTGGAVDSLTPVSRFANLSFPASSADEPFHLGSYVEFDAVMGTTYYFAVDGATAEFGNISLTIDSNFTFLDPVAELLPAGSDWSYLLYTELQDTGGLGLANVPVDPETVDPDFDTTWHTPSLYDGPAFSGPAPALLGYGAINSGPLATDIWGDLDNDGDGLADVEPADTLYDTTYLRASFTPTEAAQHLGFEGLVDDGAIIYFDGVEVARINVGEAKDANDFQTLADGTTFDDRLGNTPNDEDVAQVVFVLDQNLPAGVPVEVAVSLHQASIASSDTAFDLRIWSVNPPPDPPTPPVINLNVRLAPNDPGAIELLWNSEAGKTYAIEFSFDLDFWSPFDAAIAADPSGTNSYLDFTSLGIDAELFYRVLEE